MANITYPDVIATVFSTPTQKLGDVIVLAPAAQPMSQIYTGHGYIGAHPSGEFVQYKDRFDDYTYYTTHSDS